MWNEYWKDLCDRWCDLQAWVEILQMRVSTLTWNIDSIGMSNTANFFLMEKESEEDWDKKMMKELNDKSIEEWECRRVWSWIYCYFVRNDSWAFLLELCWTTTIPRVVMSCIEIWIRNLKLTFFIFFVYDVNYCSLLAFLIFWSLSLIGYFLHDSYCQDNLNDYDTTFLKEDSSPVWYLCFRNFTTPLNLSKIIMTSRIFFSKKKNNFPNYNSNVIMFVLTDHDPCISD